MKKLVAKWTIKTTLDTLYKRARSIRRVKTIWQVNKPVDLDTFYYPASILYDGARIPLNDLDNFPSNVNVLVQGIVGQGKSLLFRFLTCRELTKGRRLPLYVELRHLAPDCRLVDRLLIESEYLGLSIERDLLLFLFASGRVVLLLDGFDEVPSSQRSALLAEIDGLTRKYDKLRIYLSSRPHSGAIHSAAFHVCELAPLDAGDCKSVVMRLLDDEQVAMKIINELGNRPQLLSVLTTPLLVGLLIFRYRVEQTLPDNEVAFYDNMFDLLLRRHDKSKIFDRPRLSKLSDRELQRVFDALSFITRKQGIVGLRYAALCEFVDKAVQTTGLTDRPDAIARDIIDITCLILEEGGETNYIHKSVQEYHAARFIAVQRDSTVSAFYDAMKVRWRNWEQELRFLSQLDRRRYLEHFFIPLGLELLEKPAVDQLPFELEREYILRFCSINLSMQVGAYGRNLSINAGKHPLDDHWSNGDISYRVFASDNATLKDSLRSFAVINPRVFNSLIRKKRQSFSWQDLETVGCDFSSVVAFIQQLQQSLISAKHDVESAGAEANLFQF